jgi:hypothetical protein
MDNFRFSKAPKPMTPLRSGSVVPKPERTQSPQDLPPSYPNHLKVSTWNVIASTIKEFPQLPQIMEVCRKVISELTPVFCEEVSTARMRGDLVLSCMSDLLRYLLTCNVSNDSEHYRIDQDLKRSQEWREFLAKLSRVEASGRGGVADQGVRNVEAHIRQAQVEVESLSRELDGWRGSRASPLFKRKVDEKQQWERTLGDWLRVRERLASTPHGDAVQARAAKQNSMRKARRTSDPEVAKRRSLLQANVEVGPLEMCKILDRASVPLPPKWQAGGFKSWFQAYRVHNYTSRILVIFSKDRSKG